MAETILEPDLPIVDPHHHLWDRPNSPTPPSTSGGPEPPFMTAIADARRYLLDELLADTGSGHNVVATVFVECMSMYRADGEPDPRPGGETELVNGGAATGGAAGRCGPAGVAAGIVSFADLTLGDRVGEVLDAHAAASSRFRGI